MSQPNTTLAETNDARAAALRDGSEAERIQARPAIAPRVDIYENKDELLLVADLPGVAAGDVAIQFDKGQLTLEGKRSPLPDGNVLAAEYRPVDFRRTFAVPQGIDSGAITAELKHGVLRVHLPKVAALRPRQIEINAS